MVEKYNIEDYEDLFVTDESDLEDTKEERIERLRDKKISGYRVKTIRSGDMLEVETYPIFEQSGERGKKKKKSRKTQVRLNDKNAQKHLIRLINRNFTKEDIYISLNYSPKELPASWVEAKKKITNYIRRLKRYCEKHGLPELKYIYVTEYRDETCKRKKRVHHHMICNFPDRDIAEELWAYGERPNTKRLKPDDFGLEGLARYIGKGVKSKNSKNDEGETVKRYTPSRNLEQPIVTTADSKLSKRRAEKLALDENIAPEIFEKLYKNYSFKDMQVKFSPYVSGAYLYVRMRRIEPQENKSSRRVKQDE